MYVPVGGGGGGGGVRSFSAAAGVGRADSAAGPRRGSAQITSPPVRRVQSGIVSPPRPPLPPPLAPLPPLPIMDVDDGEEDAWAGGATLPPLPGA
eukprot:70954-Chlamydomonas_euryale.AAC.1